jgi:hypothetical protein
MAWLYPPGNSVQFFLTFFTLSTFYPFFSLSTKYWHNYISSSGTINSNMKKTILSVIILTAFSGLGSCKKEKDPGCEKTVAGIAANYKLTKVETVSTSGNNDVTDTFLDACKKNAFYSLKTDKTVMYTEISSSCTGSGNGTWDVNNGNITITGPGGFQFSNAPIESWDCSTLKITQTINVAGSTVNGRFTFVKQ